MICNTSSMYSWESMAYCPREAASANSLFVPRSSVRRSRRRWRGNGSDDC